MKKRTIQICALMTMRTLLLDILQVTRQTNETVHHNKITVSRYAQEPTKALIDLLDLISNDPEHVPKYGMIYNKHNHGNERNATHLLSNQAHMHSELSL